MKNLINSKIMLLSLLLFAVTGLQAQSYKGLKIGDQLPDISISRLLYDTKEKISTAEFNDRLLIIDFWATSCSGCVAALPHMERLQKQFGGRIKILPVTFEPAPLVDEFWKKNPHTKNLSLSTVVEDSVIKNLFPHVAIPHEVWVYKGKVIGITDPEYVDSANISLVLSGKAPSWPFKNDFYTLDGRTERLFRTDQKQIDLDNTLLEYTAVGNYREKDGASAAGVFGSLGTVRDTATKTLRTWFVNQPLMIAYLSNWMKVVRDQKLNKPSYGVDPNQIVWEVKDPLKYMHRSPVTPGLNSGYMGDWMRKNAVCFESVKADTGQSTAEIARGIIADLNRLFELDVRWEKRKEKVWVLVSDKSSPKGKAARGKAAGRADAAKAKGNTVSSVDELMYQLNQQPSNPYVFQGDGVAGEKQLNILVSSWTDIPALCTALAGYGLKLQQQERMVDKFIFTELEKEH